MAGDGRARSGLLWAEGLVVTAEEALERDDELSLTLPDGRVVPAILAGRDPGTDVALLKAGPAASPRCSSPAGGAGHRRIWCCRSAAANTAPPRPSAWRPWSAAPGGRCAAGGWTGASSSACRLDPSAEGGAVLDHAGRLVGMAVPGPRRRVLAIPAETIARSVEQLRTRGRVARGYLGLAMQPVQLGEGRGLIVVGVDPRSPAGLAGVLLGDVLAAWDGAPLGSVRDMLARLDPDSVGTTVTLELVRAGLPHRVQVRIGERAAA